MIPEMTRPAIPPRHRNFEDQPRRVGIEIELAALTARQVADAIADRFGGSVGMLDPHRFRVIGSTLGDFEAELDSRFAHPDAYPTPTNPGEVEWLDGIRTLAGQLFGDIGSLVIPSEIVAPPIEVAAIAEIDLLLADLRARGARGTDASVFYAFGVHLNPDIATRDADWILAVLKAEMLLSDTLRWMMMIDSSRDLSGFVTPFPIAYVQRVVDPTYWPSLHAMIDDYIAFNPTRDRELDMLPLFAWLETDRVRRLLPDEKIGARPTFHYRLPNAALERPMWSATREWNRWVLIEQLADDRDMLDALGRAYLRHDPDEIDVTWAAESAEWLLHRRSHSELT